MNEETLLQKKLSHYRLNGSEFDCIKQLLGRAPEGLEWALFSALWSEHCSYKSSRRHLKKFAMKSDKVLESMGENAGVIDLGHGERIAFKMESHNHPSFIEPFQGAATGVGGILRDIFTMGARPIAILDFLCFGEPDAPRMRALVEGVVSGISFYGNCVGVPTIGGKTQFDASYNGNILVNAFALGLFRPHEKIVTSSLRGPGNWVVYVGAKTGKDGVHGASMASESFEADSESKRPTVQIGDPFFEKLLIESCLEVFEQDLVVAIQDMGAAGLTSSSFEMASKGGLGLSLHLDRVPLRDASITPEEILLSESQERMLLVCEPQNFEKIKAIFHRWHLDAVRIGEVRAEPEVQLFWKGEKLVEISPKLLTEEAPEYDRPYSAWKSPNQLDLSEFQTQLASLPVQTPSGEALLERIRLKDHCSKAWIYEQYDQRVGTKTVRESGHQLSCLRLEDSGRALAMVAGCRTDLMQLDAQLGAQDAVLRPILQLASKGFEPMGITDCLNFGNPEKPEVMSQLVASIEAIAEVAKVFDAPVVSGNVSLYNETMGQGIAPTPATVVVGLREDLNLPSEFFVKEESLLFLLRCDQVKILKKPQASVFTGKIELSELKGFMDGVRRVVKHPACLGSKVVGRGGLPMALAEQTALGLGSQVVLPESIGASTELEELYQVIVEVDAAKVSEWRSEQELIQGLECLEVGKVLRDHLKINDQVWMVKEIQQAFEQGWERNFGRLS